jgi:hypothetical protein
MSNKRRPLSPALHAIPRVHNLELEKKIDCIMEACLAAAIVAHLRPAAAGPEPAIIINSPMSNRMSTRTNMHSRKFTRHAKTITEIMHVGIIAESSRGLNIGRLRIEGSATQYP